MSCLRGISTQLSRPQPGKKYLIWVNSHGILIEYQPVCWNWQTRRTQNPLLATACGFDPHHRHFEKEAVRRSKAPYRFSF